MADVMRWRYGDTNPVVMAVDPDVAIDIGDLLWVDSGLARPASVVEDQLTEATNQEYLHDRFAGVAMQRSPAGDSRPIRVATTGVFQFDCPSATYEVGDLLGASEQASGTALSDQAVEAVPTANRAIGRCAKRVPVADTTVLIDIVSVISHGGPQVVQ